MGLLQNNLNIYSEEILSNSCVRWKIIIKNLPSPAGNRTPVSRVTGGDTDHYTTEDVRTSEFYVFTQKCRGKLWRKVIINYMDLHQNSLFIYPEEILWNSCVRWKIIIKNLPSPAGNRTPVSRVTGGDTDHYTTEDVRTSVFYIFIQIGRASCRERV